MADHEHGTRLDPIGDWQDDWRSDADVAADRSQRASGASDIQAPEASRGSDPLEAFPAERAAEPQPLLARQPVVPIAPQIRSAAQAPPAQGRASARPWPALWIRPSRTTVVSSGSAAILLMGLLTVGQGWDSDAGGREATEARARTVAAPAIEAVSSQAAMGFGGEAASVSGPPAPAPLLVPQPPDEVDATPSSAPQPPAPTVRSATREERPTARSAGSTRGSSGTPDRSARTAAPPATEPPPARRSAEPATPLEASASVVAAPVLAVSAGSKPPALSQLGRSALERPAGPAVSSGSAAAAATLPSATTAPNDRQLIGGVIERYRAAFSALDARAARAVWPGVDAPALERAFGQLASQDMAFSSCSVLVEAARASASCSGSTTYVTNIGSRSTRTDYRLWDFALRKTGGGWVISAVNSR